jgi:uncharacterized cupin superfamily protein
MSLSQPIEADKVPSDSGSPYPQPFASYAASSHWRRLGDHFGLTQFGVVQSTLNPGAQAGLRHWHSLEEEFIFVLQGELCLVVNDGEHLLGAGMCVGFKAGDRNAHLLVNRSQSVAHYLIIGSRVSGDMCFYPDVDLAWFVTEDGAIPVHKDGTPYPR